MASIACICGARLRLDAVDYCVAANDVERVVGKVHDVVQGGMDLEEALYMALELEFRHVVECGSCGRVHHIKGGLVERTYSLDTEA